MGTIPLFFVFILLTAGLVNILHFQPIWIEKDLFSGSVQGGLTKRKLLSKVLKKLL